MKQRMIWGAQLLLVVLCALALKWFYSAATADDLRWILAPTTVLVELLSGKSFQFESHTGYMSSDHTFVIAAPCAGVNFLITAFMTLSLRRLWREQFQGISWGYLLLAAVVAYTTTLIANTVRIWIALQSLESDWLTRNQLHRVEGIVVYFGFLLLIFMMTERPRSPRRVPTFVFPLLIYYATTLGIPLANGSWRQGIAFCEHFVFVLILPLVLIVPVIVLTRLQNLHDFRD